MEIKYVFFSLETSNFFNSTFKNAPVFKGERVQNIFNMVISGMKKKHITTENIDYLSVILKNEYSLI